MHYTREEKTVDVFLPSYHLVLSHLNRWFCISRTGLGKVYAYLRALSRDGAIGEDAISKVAIWMESFLKASINCILVSS